MAIRIGGEWAVVDNVFRLNLKPGNIVLITSPDHFQGERIAGVLKAEKWCVEGIPVHILTEGEPIPNICIKLGHGDTIRKLT